MEYNQRKHDLSSRNLITVTATVDGAAEAVGPGMLSPAMGKIPESWDLEADVVIIGSGGAGMPAAVKAADEGASVIVVETNYDIGGHAIISGGNTPLAAARARRGSTASKTHPTWFSAISRTGPSCNPTAGPITGTTTAQ